MKKKHQGKNQTYPSPTEYAKKRKNSVSNEKKSQHRRKNKRTKLTSCLHYSKPVRIVNKPKSTEKKERNRLITKKKHLQYQKKSKRTKFTNCPRYSNTHKLVQTSISRNLQKKRRKIG